MPIDIADARRGAWRARDVRVVRRVLDLVAASDERGGPWHETCWPDESDEGEQMADGMNKAILIGNLGAEPELSYTQSNQPVLKLRLATNESWLDKDGERQERTEWHRVVVWGKRGEGLAKILAKGSQLGIEGRIQTREWQDKDGNRKWTTEIVANQVYLLGGGKRGAAGAGPDGGAASNARGHDETEDDDIPF